MAVDVRPIRADEFQAAGDALVAAYAEFMPDAASGEEGGHPADGYFQRLRDVAGRAERAVVLVAVTDGRVVGTATLEVDGRVDTASEPLSPGEAHIRMLGVDPEARGRGAGRGLVLACIAGARDAGKTVLTLNTGASMTAARALYEGIGFVRGPDHTIRAGMTYLSYTLALD